MQSIMISILFTLRKQYLAYYCVLLCIVAARVADKPKHVISKQELAVRLYIPPKPAPPPKSANNMLLLKNLPKDLKLPKLELYMDAVTDLECDEGEYSYDVKEYEGESLILVIFKDDAGIHILHTFVEYSFTIVIS